MFSVNEVTEASTQVTVWLWCEAQKSLSEKRRERREKRRNTEGQRDPEAWESSCRR